MDPISSFSMQVSTYPSDDSNTFGRVRDALRSATNVLPPMTPLEGACHRSRFIKCNQKTAVYLDSEADRIRLHGNVFRDTILTQAPMPDDFELFWKICMSSSSLIVDLTNHKYEFIDEYVPKNVGESCSFGSVQITCNGKDAQDDLTIYNLLINDGKTQKTITRINHSGWPDNAPIQVQELDTLVNLANTYAAAEKIIVHCRMGLGRTGTFTTAREIDRMVKGKVIFNPSSLVNRTCQTILRGRIARNPQFVQNDEQLRCLLEFGKWKLEGGHVEQASTPGTDSTFVLNLPPRSTL